MQQTSSRFADHLYIQKNLIMRRLKETLTITEEKWVTWVISPSYFSTAKALHKPLPKKNVRNSLAKNKKAREGNVQKQILPPLP